LIHEEIVARHAWMPREVKFLGTFNVVYRREVLEACGGFGEARYKFAAEDADLAFRLHERGYRLRFEPASRVGHYHATQMSHYLRVQQRHGFYRVRLSYDHPRRLSGDSYNRLYDLVQPPLAMLALAAAPLAIWPPLGWICLCVIALLLAAQLPMTTRLICRTRNWKYLAYIPFGFFRAFRRGFGMVAGLADVLGTALWQVTRRKTIGLQPAQKTSP
jgi:hypothetical protein